MFQFLATLSFMPLFVAIFRQLNSVRYNGVIYSLLTCTVIIRTRVQNFPPKISRDVGILRISRVFCSMFNVKCLFASIMQSFSSMQRLQRFAPDEYAPARFRIDHFRV
jgi:hypothetical protein